jgi:hypothetical protein
MTKERRNITVSPRTNEFLSRDEINASQLIDRLVLKYMETADYEQVADELESAKETRREIQIHEAYRILTEGRELSSLSAENIAVRNQAAKIGVTGQTLLKLLGDRYE